MCNASFTTAIFLLHALTLPAQHNWQLLPQLPQNGQKQDDVFFLTPELGCSVNGSGRIFKTLDGGQTRMPENLGQFVNKFRVLADVAYGIGVHIYNMTAAAGGNAEQYEADARLFAWPNPRATA